MLTAMSVEPPYQTWNEGPGSRFFSLMHDSARVKPSYSRGSFWWSSAAVAEPSLVTKVRKVVPNGPARLSKPLSERYCVLWSSDVR